METKKPWANVAREIVGKFGGSTKLAMLMKPLIPSMMQSTVNGWVSSGVIPEKYRPVLIQLAKAEGVPHTPLDYVAYLMPLAA